MKEGLSTLEQIGRRVRVFRKSAKLTQTSLAEMSGYSRVTISNIEAGRNHATIFGLYRIAEQCGCTIHDLLPPINKRVK